MLGCTHKRHPTPRPDGRAMGCLLWIFWRKLTTLYCIANLLLILALADWHRTMTWCSQATWHYLSQCCPRSMLPYAITRPQGVDSHWTYQSLFPSNDLTCSSENKWSIISSYILRNAHNQNEITHNKMKNCAQLLCVSGRIPIHQKPPSLPSTPWLLGKKWNHWFTHISVNRVPTASRALCSAKK